MDPEIISAHADVASDHDRPGFQASIAGCAVFDLSSKARIRVSGSDRVRWLNGMVTNNIRDLALGQGLYAFLLNPQGRILGDLYAYNVGDELIVETDKTQLSKILEIFERYIIMDDVEIADITQKQLVIGVVGRKAQTILAASGLPVPALQPLKFATLPWLGKEATIIRGDFPTVETYEIWVAPEDAESALAAIGNAGAVPAGATTLERMRIVSGIPRYGSDIREKDLPQETEQYRALNFNKGCYIGQEIVERIRSRGAVHRQFTGFAIDGTLPEPGVEIQFEGKKVGEITSVAAVPFGDITRNIALGYIRREISALHKSLDGGRFQATPVNVPFSEFFQN
jgi:folate-binding protein YgfZ